MICRAFCVLLLVFVFAVNFGSEAYGMYDPGLGRFCSRDPIGFVDGENLYQYVTSKPLVYVDPSGLQCWQFCVPGANPNQNPTHGNPSGPFGPHNPNPQLPVIPIPEACSGAWLGLDYLDCMNCCVLKNFTSNILPVGSATSGICIGRIDKGSIVPGSNTPTNSFGTKCGQAVSNCRRMIFPNSGGNPWPVRCGRAAGNGGGFVIVGLCGATVEAGCAAYCSGIFSGPSVTPPLPPSMPYYPPYRG
jgi:hypothetical protein